MSELLANGKVTLMCGDSRERILDIPDDSIDSIVTDPPYSLDSIVKRFGKEGSAPPREILGEKGAFNRSSRGFMNCTWDTGETAFAAEFWQQILRVLKPGGHLVAFGGTRSFHRLAVAIEDGGFEIRDQIGWCYAVGMPKSHSISKNIDKYLFRKWVDADPIRRTTFDKEIDKAKTPDKKKLVEDKWKAIGGYLRGVVGTKTMPDMRNRNGVGGQLVGSALGFDRGSMEYDYTEAATPEAAEWEGWGSALRPSWEPICLARKPMIGTLAENTLTHGTGGINIDGCRFDQQWPANVCHDGSEEVLEAFPRDTARFFFSSKADLDDRLGSHHPTIKPVDLMQWLVRLVTPKNGTVLDCFAGAGTTGEAAFREGMHAVLIEREPDYQQDIRRRMSLVLGGPQERRRASIKASGKTVDAGPLFA